MDTVTIKVKFPPVERDGELVIDDITLTLAGRPADELHDYALGLVRGLRKGDWVAEVSRHVTA